VGHELAAVLTLTLGLIASYIINQIDRLPVIDNLSSLTNLGERVLVPALAGILLVPGSEVFGAESGPCPGIGCIPAGENPSCSFLMTGAAWGWLGCLVCGALLAALTRERSNFRGDCRCCPLLFL